MRTRAALTGVFASVGILVVGWQIGAASQAATPTVSASGTTGAGSATTTASNTTTTETIPTETIPSATASAAPTTAAASSDGTWTGASVDTRFGSVQVQVTISAGSITDVTALHLTDDDGRSVQISNRAAPILQQEVLASQSASVSNVSGATYTTQAYLSSVQSALDQAGF